MNRGQKATLEMLAHKAQRETPEPQDHKVRRVIQARKAQREIQVQLERLGLKGQKVILVILVLPVPTELMPLSPELQLLLMPTPVHRPLL